MTQDLDLKVDEKPIVKSCGKREKPKGVTEGKGLTSGHIKRSQYPAYTGAGLSIQLRD